MAIRRVIGIEVDGSIVTTTFGRHEVPCLKTSYGDALETAFLVEMGSQRNAAQTPGTYKTEDATFTFRSTVWRARMMPLFPKYGGGDVIIPIVVGFTHPDMGSDSDLLQGARFTGWKAAYENSNKAAEIEVKATILQILWTSQRKTINALRGAIPVGASKF